MKCAYCGNNLHIDDEFCPYCKQENKYAVKHRKDMKRFSEDYDHTKKEVYQKNKDKVSLMAKGTIIAILIVISIFVAMASSNTYNIHNWIQGININKNIHIHMENLEKLETERDFFGLLSYYDNHSLYQSDKFADYRALVSLSSSYFTTYYTVLRLTYDKEITDSNMDRWIAYIGDDLERIYDTIQPNEYWPEQYSEKHMAAMEYLKEEVETLIHVYLKVPMEEIKTFPTLSSAKIQLLIERSMVENED